MTTMVDRRNSAWQDPKTYISLLGLLMTLCLAVGGYVSLQLSTIGATVQGIALSNAQLSADQKNLKERQDKSDVAREQDKREQASINWTLKASMLELQTRDRLADELKKLRAGK
jgi:hypothetical protein